MRIFNYLSSRPAWQQLTLILILISISYSNSLFSPFFFDDYHSFIEEPNVYINDISLDAIKKLATTDFGINRFIPLATFALDHNFVYLFNTGIAQYHVTNIVIHLLSTISIYLLIVNLFSTSQGLTLKYFRTKLFALTVCALWALNPVQTNAVTYIVQRMTSVATLFYITTLIFYIYGRKTLLLKQKLIFFIGAAITACCALMSKEISATLPIAILLLEAFFLAPQYVENKMRKLTWRHWLTTIALLIVLLPLIQALLADILASYAYRHFTLIERLLTETRIVVFYITLLILPLPSRMNLEHDFSVSHSIFAPPTTLISIIIIALLIWTAFRVRSRYPIVAFGIFWFFVNLVIESTFIPLELAFEHRLYLPSIGFFISAIGLCDILVPRLINKWPQLEAKQYLLVVFLITASIYSIFTSLRNHDWQDYLTITEDSYRKSPKKARALLNYGYALSLEGNYEESNRILEQAIAIGQTKYEAHLIAATNLLANHLDKKEYDLAVKKGETFLQITKNEINQDSLQKFLQDLSIAYIETKQYRKAYDAAASMYLIKGEDKNKNIVEIMFYTLNKAYDDTEARKQLGLDIPNATKEESIILKLAETNLESKYYEQSASYLILIKQSHPNLDKYIDLQQRHNKELEKNKIQIKLYDLKQYSIYQMNSTYRFCLDTFNLIYKYYPPLIPLTGYLLDIAYQNAMDDPFVSLYRVLFYYKLNKNDLMLAELDKAIKKHSSFTPLLEVAGDLYPDKVRNGINRSELYQKIISLYPAHPRWRYYQVLIRDSATKTSEIKNPTNGPTS